MDLQRAAKRGRGNRELKNVTADGHEPHDQRYEYIHFETADELVTALAPIPRLDTETVSPAFIFRGQACASWSLVPSALRVDRSQQTKSQAVAQFASSYPGTHDEQVFAEFHAVKAFVEACDRAVIAVPGDGHEYRARWLDDQHGEVEAAYRFPERWPWPQHLPLLAFAQHYGIPTRLLDWTRNATIAMYFAAAARIGMPEHTDNLAVWALNTEYIHLYERIEVVPMPGANSSRLGAQRGLFTLARFPCSRGELVDLQHVSLTDALISPNAGVSKTRPLWKLTLPCAEALRLLYLCHLNGVDAATVYPDAAGAALATIERAKWLHRSPDTGDFVTTRRVATSLVKSMRTRSG